MATVRHSVNASPLATVAARSSRRWAIHRRRNGCGRDHLGDRAGDGRTVAAIAGSSRESSVRGWVQSWGCLWA